MPLTIQALICDVTIVAPRSDLDSGLVASAGPTGSVASALAPAVEALPPLDLAQPELAPGPSAPSEEPVAAESAPETFTAPPTVDPKVLTERVWRLLRDDLSIARERG